MAGPRPQFGAGPPLQLLAFREHRQTMDCSEHLRLLLAKATEWNCQIAIISSDVKAAFDYMRPVAIHHMLMEQGALPSLAIAWLRENVNMSAAINLATVPSASAVAVFRGCRQGGARTPAPSIKTRRPERG